MLKYRFVIMFLIVLCGMISIAAFNPIIGPLARGMGLSEIQSGILVSVTGICWLYGGYFWEKQSFISRKKMLSLIMLVYIAALIVFAVLADYAAAYPQNTTQLFWLFLILRALSGFFFGGIPAKSQAYVMGWTTAETRTKGMALFGAANGLGFVLGPAMSGALAGAGLTVPLYIVSGMMFIMVIILWSAIADSPEKKSDRTKASLSPLDKRIRFFLWIGLLLSLCLNIVQVTIGFFVQDTLGYSAKETAQLIGTGLAISGVMVVISQVLISKFKIKARVALQIGLAFVITGFIAIAFFIEYAYLDFIILGIGIGFTLLGYSAGASHSVKDHEQRTAASYIAAVQGGGAFLGPAFGTILYTMDKAYPYICCALLLVFSGLYVWFGRQKLVKAV